MSRVKLTLCTWAPFPGMLWLLQPRHTLILYERVSFVLKHAKQLHWYPTPACGDSHVCRSMSYRKNICAVCLLFKITINLSCCTMLIRFWAREMVFQGGGRTGAGLVEPISARFYALCQAEKPSTEVYQQNGRDLLQVLCLYLEGGGWMSPSPKENCSSSYFGTRQGCPIGCLAWTGLHIWAVQKYDGWDQEPAVSIFIY